MTLARAVSPVLVTVTFQYAVSPCAMSTLDTQGPLPPAAQSVATSVPQTCLRMAMAASGTRTDDGAELMGALAPGAVPWAVAVLKIEPAPRSAGVTT